MPTVVSTNHLRMREHEGHDPVSRVLSVVKGVLNMFNMLNTGIKQAKRGKGELLAALPSHLI